MKTIFLDCGTNLGQGFDDLSKRYNIPINTEVHMFEPNIKCYNMVKEKYPNYHIHNKAVWDKNEIRVLNIEFCPGHQDLVGGATNILADNFKKPGYIADEYMHEWPPKNSQSIVCIDLSEYIQKNFKKEDYIYLKLDIEGAEYEVLDKLITDGTINYINNIMVEWHSWMRKQTEHDNNHYINFFRENNIKYLEWY